MFAVACMKWWWFGFRLLLLLLLCWWHESHCKRLLDETVLGFFSPIISEKMCSELKSQGRWRKKDTSYHISPSHLHKAPYQDTVQRRQEPDFYYCLFLFVCWFCCCMSNQMKWNKTRITLEPIERGQCVSHTHTQTTQEGRANAKKRRRCQWFVFHFICVCVQVLYFRLRFH